MQLHACPGSCGGQHPGGQREHWLHRRLHHRDDRLGRRDHRAGVATIPAFTGGSQASTLFSAAGLAAIHRSGRTQLKLRFAANQTATNDLWIDRGATATLSVTWVP